MTSEMLYLYLYICRSRSTCRYSSGDQAKGRKNFRHREEIRKSAKKDSKMALELPTGESTRELIKCVMIGDGGVGKTRLICAQALGQGIMPEKRQSLLQCSHGSHKPSVFAIDKYYKSSEIQRRSNMTVDGVRVALRMWDTFGDRQKDRRFAYQNANVIALCFSVNCPQSLESVNDYWYKEIKQSCPRVPIVLVGTKSDCRLEQPLEETKPNKRSSFSQQIKECSIVSPGMGRQVAKEIGAMYYECSVMLMIGLEDVFINVIRAALCGQRAKRLLSKQLRKVLPPQIQVPYKPPRPKTPQVEVPPSTYHTDLVSLFNNKLYHDVEFAIQGMLIKAHKAVLVAASTNFSSLFAIKLSEESKESLNKICPENISVVWPSKSIAVRNNEEGKAVTVIDMDNNINFQAFYSLLKLLYSGSTSAVENIPDLMDAAKLMKVKLLESFLSRVDSDASLFSLWKEAMVFNMRQTLFKKELFSDVCFELDDAIIPAHKAILVSRCEMMAAMFEEGHFKEADRQIVSFITVYYWLQIYEKCGIPSS